MRFPMTAICQKFGQAPYSILQCIYPSDFIPGAWNVKLHVHTFIAGQPCTACSWDLGMGPLFLAELINPAWVRIYIYRQAKLKRISSSERESRRIYLPAASKTQKGQGLPS